MAGIGVMKGAPDLLLWFDNRSYALELKSGTGRPTVEQLEMLARLDAQGVYTALTYGLDASIRCLECWQLLKGRAQ